MKLTHNSGQSLCFNHFRDQLSERHVETFTLCKLCMRPYITLTNSDLFVF